MAAKLVLFLGGLFGLGFLFLVLLPSHGHVHEPLDVTVRVVDGKTGKPLAGAVVAVVPYRNQLEHESLEWRLKDALEHPEARPRALAASMSGAETTTVRSAAYVTRFWLAGIRTSTEVGVPDFLLVDHPRHGRTIVPIDEKALREGAEENTWRLDLGTVRVP